MATKTNGKPSQPTANGNGREMVAVYGRVSSEDQKEAGSIENQVDFGTRYCDLHQLPVFDFYKDEAVSGTVPVHQRPEGARLLRDAAAGKFGAVLVYRLDRMARSTRVLLDVHDRLDLLGVALRSMTEPFDTASPIGKFIMTLLASLSELERATILERTTLGRFRAARDGRWLGGTPPFGYTVEGEEHKRRLAASETEAAIVRRIFKLYVEDGLPIVRIVDLLNAENVPICRVLRNGPLRRWKDRPLDRWHIGPVSQILRNTAYVGLYRQNRRGNHEIVEYACPPIVDEATFAAAQLKLEENLAEAMRNAKRNYLLRGMIRCRCDRPQTLVGKPMGGSHYYRCKHCRFKINAKAAEAAVWGDVQHYIDNPGEPLEKLRVKLGADARDEESLRSDIVEVEGQINVIREQRLTYARQNAKGFLGDSEFEHLMAESGREIEALEGKKQGICQRQAVAQASQAALLSAEALLVSLREKARNADDATKRDLLKLLVLSIQVEEDGVPKVIYRFSNPGGLTPDGDAYVLSDTSHRNAPLNLLIRTRSVSQSL